MNSTIKTCRKQGYVTNIFGRRIHLRGINDKNFSVSFSRELPLTLLFKDQADIIRLAMIKINKVLEDKKHS